MLTDAETSDLTSGNWILACIVEVEHTDRIQCQCDGCGRIIYKGIHIIIFGSNKIECWGSTCYAKRLGKKHRKIEPLYPSPGGRRLTEQQREWLRGNRDKLIAAFDAERQLAAASEREAQVVVKAKRPIADERLSMEETGRRFHRDRESHTPPNLLRNRDSLSSQPPNRFSSEPLDDPIYCEIRDKLSKQWAQNGIDIDRPGQKKLFWENVQRLYARRLSAY